ncbi:phage tail spike protein [Candidatus Enterococcus murrayae]|uniref:Phage tail protein n=1 Tax=Candidatus Enterococcus murrayae TaxID=2815321 RepID=A0ABS3HCU9_9ENTE|nr:phage tail spike protein [Enterococcus sp. MJM16]MBO0450750.1 phage tail protein [Enterococcus sp. MJM16]
MTVRKRRPVPIIVSKDNIYTGGVDLKSKETYVAPDAISVKATNVINGEQVVTIIYPVKGANATAFGVGLLIYLRVNNYQLPQIYRIFSVKKTMKNQRIEIKAEPIINDLRHFGIPVLNGNTVSPNNYWNMIIKNAQPKVTTAMNGYYDKAPFNFPYRFYDFSSGVLGDVKFVLGTALEAIAGKQGSMLDTFKGGEFLKDNNSLNYYDRLGSDRGFVIAYGLNLKDVDFSIDTTDTIWNVIAWYQYQDTDGVTQYKYGNPAYNTNVDTRNYGLKTLFLEVEEEEGSPSGALTRLAREYLNNNTDMIVPKTSMKIDFVNLEGKDGYEDYAQLQDVRLGDDVTIKYNEFGLDLKTRVVSYEYDLLLGQYTKMELGDTRRSFVNQYRSSLGTVYNQAFNTRGAVVEIQPT